MLPGKPWYCFLLGGISASLITCLTDRRQQGGELQTSQGAAFECLFCETDFEKTKICVFVRVAPASAARPSLAVVVRGCPSGSAPVSHRTGFSSCQAQALGAHASIVLVGWLSFCSTGAELSPGTWDLPGPGIEPVSPALAGGFFTTEPPGKPSALTLFGTRIQAQTLKPKPVATLLVS